MKWPFVSRFAFEAALEVSRLAREDAREARRALQDMTAKYHQLRLQGQVMPEPKPEPIPARVVDPVVAAINERFVSSPILRAAALQQAARDRAAEKSDADILAAIYEGQAVYEEGTPI